VCSVDIPSLTKHVIVFLDPDSCASYTTKADAFLWMGSQKQIPRTCKNKGKPELVSV